MGRIDRIGSEGAPSGAPSPVRRLAASASLLAAAGIHAAVTPEHLVEWVPAGLFFAVLAAGQAMLAMLVLRSGTPRAGAAAIALSLAAIAVWALAHGVGIPLGPHAGVPEAVGFADLVATLLELATIGALAAPRRGRRLGAAAIATAGAIMLVGLTAGAMALGASPATGGRDAPEMCPSSRPAISYLDHAHHHDPCAPK